MIDLSATAQSISQSTISNSMQLQLFDNFDQLREQRHQWDRVAGAFPFHRWAWLGNWFEHLGKGCEPAVLVAIENGEWQSIAPFLIDRDSIDNRLRFWGSGKACTDYTSLICRDSNADAFALAVVDWLTNETASGGRLAEVDLIELEGLTSEREADLMLLKIFAASGFDSHSVELEGCWVADLPATWDEMNKRFSKSMRRKTKKAVQRTSDVACQIESTKHADFETLWTQFVALHQQRRQMLRQAGCFADPEFEMFLKNATQDLVNENRAELVVINFDEKPLASMLMLNDVTTNFMYQSGADCSRMKLEPGYQMALIAIQKSIDNGFQIFDFMRGDEPYKSRWDTRRVPITRTRLIPRKLKARFKHNLWLTGQTIKQYIRPASE
jgi:CelD/BcsL family acetyltransferase involved in cellulose biosynthesis